MGCFPKKNKKLNGNLKTDKMCNGDVKLLMDSDSKNEQVKTGKKG